MMNEEDENLELGIEDSELVAIAETQMKRQIRRIFGYEIGDILQTEVEFNDRCDRAELARNYPDWSEGDPLPEGFHSANSERVILMENRQSEKRERKLEWAIPLIEHPPDGVFESREFQDLISEVIDDVRHLPEIEKD
jgi:hypothetical protein